MALVVVGLGNPGAQYAKTRHNAGRMVAELVAARGVFNPFAENKTAKALVAKGVLGGAQAIIVLPETMMNSSGKAIPPFIKTPRAAKNLLVLHDDLDLPLGTIKMVVGRGSGGHKGVESIMRAIKSKDFARIRIGISPKKHGPAFAKATAGKEEKVIKQVLGAFKPAEQTALKKALKKAALAAELFAREGPEAAMLFANTRS